MFVFVCVCGGERDRGKESKFIVEFKMVWEKKFFFFWKFWDKKLIYIKRLNGDKIEIRI